MAVDGTNSISRLAAHHFDDIKASEKKPKEEPEKKVAEKVNTDAATLDVSGTKEVKQTPETYKAAEVKKPEQDIKSRGDPVSEKAQEYASVGNDAKTETKSVESDGSDVKAVTKSIANADEAESSAQKLATSIKSEPSIAVMAQANQSANMVQQLLS